MLLDDGKEAGDQIRIRHDNSLPEEGSALGPADVKNIAIDRKIGKTDIICRAGKGIGQTGSVKLEGNAALSGYLVERLQFFPGVESPVLGRMGNIDHAGHDHVFAVIVVIIVF